MSLVRCVCCKFFGIAVWNSNSITDDDFDVYLNGTLIGSIVGGSDTYTGRLWSFVAAQFDAADFGPQHPNVFQSTLALDPSLLMTGSNTLRLKNTHVYGSGDFGIVTIAYWKQGEITTGYNDLHGAPLFSGNYGSGLTLLGGTQDFTFTYP